MGYLGRGMRARRRRRTRGPEWRTERGRGSRGRVVGGGEAGRRRGIGRRGVDSVWSYFFTSIGSVETGRGLVSWQKSTCRVLQAVQLPHEICKQGWSLSRVLKLPFLRIEFLLMLSRGTSSKIQLQAPVTELCDFHSYSASRPSSSHILRAWT